MEAFCFRSIERAECYAGKLHGLQSNGVRFSCQHHYPITPGLRDHRLLRRAGSLRRGPISQLFKSVRKKVQTSAQTEKQKTHSRMLRHCRVTLEILICPSALPSQRTQILRVDRSIRPERMCTFRKTTVALVCSFIPSPFFLSFLFFFCLYRGFNKTSLEGETRGENKDNKRRGKSCTNNETQSSHCPWTFSQNGLLSTPVDSVYMLIS